MIIDLLRKEKGPLGYIACSVPCIDIQNVHDFVMSFPTKLFADDLMEIVCPALEAFPKINMPWDTAIVFFRGKSRDDIAAVCLNQDHPDDASLARVQGYVYTNHTVDGKLMSLDAFRHDIDRKTGDLRCSYTRDGSKNSDPEMSRIKTELSAKLVAIACSFANCKNVKCEKVPVSRQVRRYAERHGEPVYEHHVLRIEPMQKAMHATGVLKTQGDIAKAIHICRGHFAQYGEEYGKGKPFGKFEGQYWVSQHVRGSLDAGVVTKDYEIARVKQ